VTPPLEGICLDGMGWDSGDDVIAIVTRIATMAKSEAGGCHSDRPATQHRASQEANVVPNKYLQRSSRTGSQGTGLWRQPHRDSQRKREKNIPRIRIEAGITLEMVILTVLMSFV